MQAYVMSYVAWDLFLARMIEEATLVGPRERPGQPGFNYFDVLRDPSELQLAYISTTIPPKKVFFPPTETLFSFMEDGLPQVDRVRETAPLILIGVHPCDLEAIKSLDIAYSYPPAESRWAANRERAVIIGVDCVPDEYCFCDSMGSIQSRSACDLFVTRIEDAYLIEVHTLIGKELLDSASKESAHNTWVKEAHDRQSEKVSKITAHFNAPITQFADILERGGLTPVWQEVASRCYSCGSCNTTCPTCFCFNIHDEYDLTLAGGARKRSWDSCQLLEFALVAGGHNFRAERWQRVRHRWHRKFLYLFRRLGRPYCTGCGRCSRACTADINIVDVSNDLIGFSKKEVRNNG